MKAILLKIEGIEYAFPDKILMNLIGNIVIEHLTDLQCEFKSSYGNCIIKGHSLKDMIEIMNNDLNKFIQILLQNGIKKEQLPIWPSNK